MRHSNNIGLSTGRQLLDIGSTLTSLGRAGRLTQYRSGQRAPAVLLATMSAGPLAVDVPLSTAKPWRPATPASAVQAVQAAISARPWRQLGYRRWYSPTIGWYRRLDEGEPAPAAPQNQRRVIRDRDGIRWGWAGVVAPPAVRGEGPEQASG